MMRTQELRAVGGWGATPSSDDLSMFAAISERGAGYNDPAVTWLYRMHDGQLSRQEAWWSNDGRSKPIAIQRVHAIRHGNGSPPLHRHAVSVLPPGGEQKRPSGWWRD